MNYELISKLTMEENEKLKIEISLLRTRNEILHHETETLRAMVKKVQEEKAFLEKEVESLKSAISFKKQQDSYTIPAYS